MRFKISKKVLNALAWYLTNMVLGLFPVVYLMTAKLFHFDYYINATINDELTNFLEEFTFSFVSCGIAFAVSLDAYFSKLKVRRPYDLIAVMLLMSFLAATSVPFLITVFAHTSPHTFVLLTSQGVITLVTGAYSITIKSKMP